MLITAVSCSKNAHTPSPGKFSATINDVKTDFTIKTASLVRSALTNEKRIDIGGVSKDGKYVLVLSIIENTAAGNSVALSTYPVRLSNVDDPDTQIDESIDTNTFVSLGIYTNNQLQTDIYMENGHITVTDTNEDRLSVSGNFEVRMKSRSGGGNFRITDGRFKRIKYAVIN